MLITDLSFIRDHREQTLSSVEDLISKLRLEFPDLKIIVYAAKDRLQKVRLLLKTQKINGYVYKGRPGLIELKEAVDVVYANNLFLSPRIKQALHAKTDLEIEDYDIQLVQMLPQGLSQDEISAFLKSKKRTPASLSSIEKRLNKLRIQFQANNTCSC